MVVKPRLASTKQNHGATKIKVCGEKEKKRILSAKNFTSTN
jgi:hypothetical protein